MTFGNHDQNKDDRSESLLQSLRTIDGSDRVPLPVPLYSTSDVNPTVSMLDGVSGETAEVQGDELILNKSSQNLKRFTYLQANRIVRFEVTVGDHMSEALSDLWAVVKSVLPALLTYAVDALNTNYHFLPSFYFGSDSSGTPTTGLVTTLFGSGIVVSFLLLVYHHKQLIQNVFRLFRMIFFCCLRTYKFRFWEYGASEDDAMCMSKQVAAFTDQPLSTNLFALALMRAGKDTPLMIDGRVAESVKWTNGSTSLTLHGCAINVESSSGNASVWHRVDDLGRVEVITRARHIKLMYAIMVFTLLVFVSFGITLMVLSVEQSLPLSPVAVFGIFGGVLFFLAVVLVIVSLARVTAVEFYAMSNRLLTPVTYLAATEEEAKEIVRLIREAQRPSQIMV